MSCDYRIENPRGILWRMAHKRWLSDLNSQWSVLNSIAYWLIWCALSRFHWTISEVGVFTPLLLQHSVILILGTLRLTWLDFTSSGQMYVHIPWHFFFVTTFCSVNHCCWVGYFFMIWSLMSLENANHTQSIIIFLRYDFHSKLHLNMLSRMISHW